MAIVHVSFCACLMSMSEGYQNFLFMKTVSYEQKSIRSATKVVQGGKYHFESTPVSFKAAWQ